MITADNWRQEVPRLLARARMEGLDRLRDKGPMEIALDVLGLVRLAGELPVSGHALADEDQAARLMESMTQGADDVVAMVHRAAATGYYAIAQAAESLARSLADDEAALPAWSDALVAAGHGVDLVALRVDWEPLRANLFSLAARAALRLGEGEAAERFALGGLSGQHPVAIGKHLLGILRESMHRTKSSLWVPS